MPVDKLNIPELLEEIVARTGHEKGEIRTILDAYHSTIVDAVSSEKQVAISGFGKYSLKESKSRRVVDHNTATVIFTEPRKSLKFTPSTKITEDLTIGSCG